jgi:hypothetical protein
MRRHRSTLFDEAWYRGAVGLLGAVLGAFIALVLALPVMYLAHLPAQVGRIAAAGAIAGATVGMLAPTTLIYGVQAIVYFVLGFIGIMSGSSLGEPPESAPKWLWAAFVFGVVYFAALVIL